MLTRLRLPRNVYVLTAKQTPPHWCAKVQNWVEQRGCRHHKGSFRLMPQYLRPLQTGWAQNRHQGYPESKEQQQKFMIVDQMCDPISRGLNAKHGSIQN